MTTRSMTRLVAAATILLCATTASAQSGALRAGAAKADITPSADMFPLRGGQPPYESVHDPLFARALVLDNGTDKVALISVDTTSLPIDDELIDAVTKGLKIPSKKAITNRIKPGCAEPAMVNAFRGMMEQYLPVWKSNK